MKLRSYGLCLVVLTASLAVAADLTLSDGRVLKDARVVAIGKEQASIVHAGGSIGVPLDAVPLEVLARAHMAIEETAAERKKKAAEITAKAAERAAIEKEKKDDEIRLRLAAANVRASANGQEQVQLPKVSTSDLSTRLAALKARFPSAEKRKVSVRIENANGGSRFDTIEVDVPHPDVLQKYRGWVMSASATSLSSVLAKLDSQFAADFAATGDGANLRGSARSQATYSREWLQRTLRPYLAELRALTR